MQNKNKPGEFKSRDRVRRVNRVRDRDRAGGERVILFEKHLPPPLPGIYYFQVLTVHEVREK